MRDLKQAVGAPLETPVMQHTPGPWRTRTLTDHDGPPACDEVQVQGVIDGVWQCIAQCEWSDDGKHAPTKPEALANARVIAAATGMENALRSLLLHAERMSKVMDNECGIRFRDDGPMALARDALARTVGAA